MPSISIEDAHLAVVFGAGVLQPDKIPDDDLLDEVQVYGRMLVSLTDLEHPVVVLIARRLREILGDVHGQPLDHGDHDNAVKMILDELGPFPLTEGRDVDRKRMNEVIARLGSGEVPRFVWDKDPIPMFLTCPWCGTRHIDKWTPDKDWSTHPHAVHACQKCGLPWRPAVVDTVGVAFLPGFKNDLGEPGVEACSQEPEVLSRHIVHRHASQVLGEVCVLERSPNGSHWRVDWGTGSGTGSSQWIKINDYVIVEDLPVHPPSPLRPKAP